MQKFLQYQQTKNYQNKQNSIQQSSILTTYINTPLQSTKLISNLHKNKHKTKFYMNLINDSFNDTFQIGSFLDSNKQQYTQQLNQYDMPIKSLKETKSQCLQQKYLEVTPKYLNRNPATSNYRKSMIQNRDIQLKQYNPDFKLSFAEEIELKKKSKYVHRKIRLREFKISQKFYFNVNEFEAKSNTLSQYEISQNAQKIPLRLGFLHLRMNHNQEMAISCNKEIKYQRSDRRKNIHCLSIKNEQNIKKQINKSFQNRKSINKRDVSNSNSKKKLTLTVNFNHQIKRLHNFDISQICF